MILPCTQRVLVSEEIPKSVLFQGLVGDMQVEEVEAQVVLDLVAVGSHTVIVQTKGYKTSMHTYIQIKGLAEAVMPLLNYKVANHPRLLVVEGDPLPLVRNLKPYNPAINIRTQPPQIHLHVSALLSL